MVIRKQAPQQASLPERKRLSVELERVLEKQALEDQIKQINFNAAGIDVGSRSHFVAVPPGRDEVSVKEFLSFTADLERLADWLEQCSVETVVMESTGVYWIALFELLESRGFEVLLVNAHHVHNVPGRKTDVMDCQWLQQLHTYGLLAGSFRPEQSICTLRAYLRQRETLVRYAAAHIQHMQKALNQMNLQLHHVVNDITGVTGLKIIRAILDGERDPVILAKHRNPGCKNATETLAKALHGNWREEHLFALRQAVELFDLYQQKIQACDQAIEQLLNRFEKHTDQAPPKPTRTQKASRNTPKFDLHNLLYRITGVDLSRIDALNPHTLLKIIAETGIDMSRWPSAKHFASWLGLSPGNKISGGKRLGGRTTPSANRAAGAFRLAARSLYASQSALGGFFRRQKARLGSPKAITATAHKLARIFYSMLKNQTVYDDPGADAYEQRYRQRVLHNLKQRAAKLGFDLVERHHDDPQPRVT
jgi:transposase